MPLPRQTPLGVPAPLLGLLVGTALGLATFVVAALLWRAGETQAAATTANTAVLAALSCLAAAVVLAQPARRRRARVPVNRAVPQQWWPREVDSVPLIAACVGAPFIAAAGMAVLLFR